MGPLHSTGGSLKRTVTCQVVPYGGAPLWVYTLPTMPLKSQEAGLLAHQLVSTSKHRGEALARLRKMYPEVGWFCDDNYGLSLLYPPDYSTKALPLAVRFSARHIIRATPNGVVYVKDVGSRILSSDEHSRIRLFQVITGLVPTGEMNEHTEKMLRVVCGGPEELPTKRSCWERLMEDED